MSSMYGLVLGVEEELNVGAEEGDTVRLVEGRLERNWVGLADGMVVLGVAEGNTDGLNKGCELKLVVGVEEGDTDGSNEGWTLGAMDALALGVEEEPNVGVEERNTVGLVEGRAE